jgi:hypothetical protein
VDPLAELAPQMTPYHYASNDPVNRIDPTGMEDDESKEKLPKKIRVKKDDGQEATVKIKFEKTKSDNKSADQKVTSTMKKAFEGAIREAAKEIKLTSVTVKATTNGKHSNTSRHRTGKAIDINKVNDKKVERIGNSDPVKALQKAFENQTGHRENFGPSIMKKNGKEYIHNGLSAQKKAAREKIKKAHQNHIHWSVN